MLQVPPGSLQLLSRCRVSFYIRAGVYVRATGPPPYCFVQNCALACMSTAAVACVWPGLVLPAQPPLYFVPLLRLEWHASCIHSPCPSLPFLVFSARVISRICPFLSQASQLEFRRPFDFTSSGQRTALPLLSAPSCAHCSALGSVLRGPSVSLGARLLCGSPRVALRWLSCRCSPTC